MPDVSLYHEDHTSAPARTGTDDRDLVLQQYRRYVNQGIARLSKLMNAALEVRSAGSLVFDEHDTPYLDCGGYGVFLVGHCHPVVIAAVKAQLERHPLATRILINPELGKAAEALIQVVPPGLQFVCFTNSGAEASEVGIKIARLNGRHKLVAMHGGYHGKTLGALSVTGRPLYQQPFRPLLPEVTFVPFGDATALEPVLRQHGEQTCVILEPIQAEGGVIVPPDGYLREVRQLCTRYGAFLVLDEIQTGMGRLGTWWGADQEAVVPDVLLVGKGLSGGVVPVAAAVATAQAYAPLNRDPLLHSSTFAGNPLAMAAVQAVLTVMQQEQIVARARELGVMVATALRDLLLELCPRLVTAVRGRGLLIGIEFQAEHIAGDFMIELLQRRVVTAHSLNAHRVVRLTPPAVLTPAECDWLLGAVKEAAIAIQRHDASPR